MNLTRCSKTVALVALFALALGAVSVAGALTINDAGVPDEAEVGENENIEITLEDVDEQGAPFTIDALSTLDDATVSITATGPGVEESDSGDGAAQLEADPDQHSEVTIIANGDIPEIEEYNYEDKDEENVLALQVERDGATLDSWEVHRYTGDSKDAREAIDDANDVVEDADSDDARERLDEAIVHYNNGEFDRAISAAEDAKDIAESEGETLRMLLLIGAGIVVVGLVVGGAYLYKSRQQDTNKLQ